MMAIILIVLISEFQVKDSTIQSQSVYTTYLYLFKHFTTELNGVLYFNEKYHIAIVFMDFFNSIVGVIC